MNKLTLALAALMLFSCQAITSFDDSGHNNDNKETLCSDGLDNDGDSHIDCEDQDCSQDAACLILNNTNNTNNINNLNNNNINNCAIMDALSSDPNVRGGCNPEELCRVSYDLRTEAAPENILGVTVTGAHCALPMDQHGYFEQCDTNTNCPKASMCIAQTCVPLADTTALIPPCDHTVMAGAIQLDYNTWWMAEATNSTMNEANFISLVPELIGEVERLPLPYCYFAFSPVDNTISDYCNILDGDYYITGGEPVFGHACMVMPGEGVIRPNQEVQWLQAGVAPVFGHKKQSETCKTNEECAPGFLCSKVTSIESRSPQCRKICNTAAACNSMTCSMFSGLLDLSFTIGNSTDASYGVCYGTGEL